MTCNMNPDPAYASCERPEESNRRVAGETFYAAEAVTVLAYVAWCSSVQRRHERKFTMTRVATVDAVAAGLILAAFRYNQRYNCKVTGKWR